MKRSVFRERMPLLLMLLLGIALVDSQVLLADSQKSGPRSQQLSQISVVTRAGPGN